MCNFTHLFQIYRSHIWLSVREELQILTSQFVLQNKNWISLYFYFIADKLKKLVKQLHLLYSSQNVLSGFLKKNFFECNYTQQNL